MSRGLKEKYLFLKVRLNKDADAFGELYDIYIDQIFRFIYFKVSTKEEAEDLSAEVFLKTWQHINDEEKKDIDNLKSFLYRTARNLVIDSYRQRKKNVQESYTTHSEDNQDESKKRKQEEMLTDTRKNPLEKLELHSDIAELKKAIEKLNNDYREAILLRYVEEMKMVEIAKIIDRSKGATRVLVHRAIQALKKIVEKV